MTPWRNAMTNICLRAGKPTPSRLSCPKTRKSGAFWGPFACARLSGRKHLAISHWQLALCFSATGGATAKQQPEPILHRFHPKPRKTGALWGPRTRSHQRLDLGIQDGMSRGTGVAEIGCSTGETVWRELPASAWQGDNLSGSFHSPLLVPRSGSVRMTGVWRIWYMR